MSTIKSSDEHLTLNADGSSKDIKFQANGVEKASISSAGAFTSTTIDATALTGNLPALNASALTNLDAADVSGTHTNFTSTGIDDNADATAITITSAERIGINHTTPEARLEIDGGGETGLKVLATVANEYAAIFQSASTNSTPIADFRKSGGTSQLQVLADGRGLSQFTAKVWAKIYGGSSPASIYDSHNVSSITDNGVAQYTVNFSNNMGNDDYCAVAHSHAGAGTNDVMVVQMPIGSRAVGSVGLHLMWAPNSASTFDNNQDADTEILIFGD